MIDSTQIHPRVAASHLAEAEKAERGRNRSAGWTHTLYGFKSTLRSGMKHQAKCVALADIVRSSRWYAVDVAESPDGDLWQVVDEMVDAEDPTHLDDCLSALYDLADYDRVWIA